MAETVILNEENFDATLNGGQTVLVDFWAEWCGPCKMLTPTIDELAGEFDGKAVVAKVNVDSNPNLSVKYGIRSIPALIIFKNGEVVEKMVGVQPKKTLKSKLEANL